MAKKLKKGKQKPKAIFSRRSEGNYNIRDEPDPDYIYQRCGGGRRIIRKET